MNIQEIDTKTIASCYICAIEYYDISGLDNEEIALVDKFLAKYPNCWFDYSEESHFTKDYLTGLMADCIDVKIMGELAQSLPIN